MEDLPFLGEIIVSPEVAVNRAQPGWNNPQNELKRLLLHGILHLLGYDHETDRGQMNRLQANMLRRRFSTTAACLADLKVNR
jgi:probable rRNA maturation factor